MPKLFDNIFNGIYNAVDKGIGLPEKVFDATVRLSGRDIGPEDFFRTDSLPDRFTVFLPFAGGQLSEDALEGAMRALNDAYWMAKEKNKKFTPKKYRHEGE